MKRDFLAVHDYGTGGIWIIMRANTEQEITSKYPELSVVHDRPQWMTDADYSDIRRKMFFDMDQPPSGWLLELIRERAQPLGRL